MRIAHLSDIHFFKCQFRLKTLFSKSLLGILNHYLNPKRTSLDFDLFALPEFLKKEKVTHVIISGDFTTTSNLKEYHEAVRFIRKLEEQNFKVIAIPGNHDLYTRVSETSKRFYHYIKASKALKEYGLSCEDLGEGFKCICLDTTLATPYWSSQGLFSQHLEKRLLTLLQEIPSDQPLILINHFPVFAGDRPKRHQMKRYEVLRGILERFPNIVLYLYGHTHKSEFTMGSPLMINSGSLTLSHKGSFHIMDLSKEFLQVKAYSYEQGAWSVRIKKSFPIPLLSS